MAEGSKKVVYAALIGNLGIAAIKTIAAVVTGSSAMTSEAVHSFVDTGNEILLLYGMRRSRRAPDALHPLGYGRELYFWSFIVALLIFAVGAMVTLYEGILHIRAPEPISRPIVSYAVLGLSLLFEGGSWIVAAREFRKTKGPRTVLQTIRASKDPPSFMVLLEDSAAIIGILFALAGTLASEYTGDARFDGLASVGIAAILATVSILLVRESKGLLIGESANPALQASIAQAAGSAEGVEQVHSLLTVHLAPNQVLAWLSIDFADDLTVGALEKIIDRLDADVRAAHPQVVALFVRPQARRSFDEAHQHRLTISTADAGGVEGGHAP